jgi:hypothetical protein
LASGGIVYSADKGTVTLTGTQAAINATLATLKYTSNTNYLGPDNLTMTTSDGNGGTDTDTVDISVGVAPKFDSALTASVNENTPTTEAVYSTLLSADSVSTGVTYSLSPADLTLLQIDSTTGTVTLNNSADYETKSSYSFTVIATSADGYSNQQIITLTVNDVNEAPTNIGITLNQNDTSLAERKVGTSAVTVGTLSAVDPDSGDTLSYKLVSDNDGNGRDADNDLFQIIGNSLQLKAGANVDYEASPELKVYVEATDKNGLTFTKVMTIQVGNVNETRTGSLTLDGETVPGNTVYVADEIADPDGIPNAPHTGAKTYQWQSSATVNGTYTNIVGANGETYLFGSTADNRFYRVVLTYTDGSGTANSVTSAAAKFVNNALPTGEIIINALANNKGFAENDILSVTSTVADENGLKVGTKATYTWQYDTGVRFSNGAIKWATLTNQNSPLTSQVSSLKESPTALTLDDFAVGKKIRVMMEYTDANDMVHRVYSDRPKSDPKITKDNRSREEVVGVNDRPVLATNADLALASLKEDLGGLSAAPPSNGSLPNGAVTSVLTLLGTRVTDADISPVPKKGIAITSLDSSAGKLWYTTDRGANWAEVPTTG